MRMKKSIKVGAALLVAAMASVSALADGTEVYKPAKAPLMTEWGAKVTPENAWREYPRPQMVREGWQNLNGLWDYTVTSNDVDGYTRKLVSGKILVPFAIESALSGVGRLTGKEEMIEYRRTFSWNPNDARTGSRRRTLLHFDGVDYRAQVFVNGIESGVPHEGAQTGFTYDVTDLVKAGDNELHVRVWDPTQGFVNPLGKQTNKPHGCFYTRVSGIWQTVWLEDVPAAYIESYNVVPDIDKGVAYVTVNAKGDLRDVSGTIEVFAPMSSFPKPIAKVSFEGCGEPVAVELPKDSLKLWSPEDPALYGMNITLKTGAGWFSCDTSDTVFGYFAMRKFEKRKDANGVLRFFLNNEPYFIVGTLDQGWWPDGLLTPPSEEAMAHDIMTLKACGFNMMRKHIKVEPLRYYALCDKLGLLVLQDMPSGDEKEIFSFSHANVAYGAVRREWQAVMDKLMAVPSIVMWIPYNEQWTQPGQEMTADMLRWTKRYDPSHRLVNGPSGWRDYEGGDRGHADKHRSWTSHLSEGEEESCDVIDRHDYGTRPTMHAVNSHRVSFLGEYGGIGCRVKDHLWTESAWGYGNTGNDVDRKAVEKKYVDLTDHVATLAAKGLAGCVYTQTTDVEAEINGLMTYDRKVLKFDAAVLKAAHDRLRAAARAKSCR